MGEIKKVYTIDGREFKGRAIKIASGAMERTNKYKGEEEFLGKGVIDQFGAGTKFEVPRDEIEKAVLESGKRI